MPSAAKMQSEGIGIQSFTMKLLEKIEELTLHMIKQDETIQKQQKEIELHKRLDEKYRWWLLVAILVVSLFYSICHGSGIRSSWV